MREPCSECGVPEYITSGHGWMSNGDICSKSSPDQRVVFMECEVIDPLIKSIENAIGMPIERIVMPAYRNAARAYVESLLPENIRETVRSMVKQAHTEQADVGVINYMFSEVARLLGYGNFRFVDLRLEQDKDDFYTVSITEPFCLLLNAASHAGTTEAVLGYSFGVTYSETSPGFYEMKAFPSEHPQEIEKRMELRLYQARDGDIELERCGACGGPKALSGFQWYVERGVILNKTSGRRMAVMMPNQVEPVFNALEEELGGEVPSIIVEAQRQFVKTGFYSAEDIGDKDKLREWLALRGLGNLREFDMGSKGMRMRLENATMHLLVTGMMQGVFEATYDVDSSVEWKLSEEDSLEIEVRPRG